MCLCGPFSVWSPAHTVESIFTLCLLLLVIWRQCQERASHLPSYLIRYGRAAQSICRYADVEICSPTSVLWFGMFTHLMRTVPEYTWTVLWRDHLFKGTVAQFTGPCPRTVLSVLFTLIKLNWFWGQVYVDFLFYLFIQCCLPNVNIENNPDSVGIQIWRK